MQGEIRALPRGEKAVYKYCEGNKDNRASQMLCSSVVELEAMNIDKLKELKIHHFYHNFDEKYFFKRSKKI